MQRKLLILRLVKRRSKTSLKQISNVMKKKIFSVIFVFLIAAVMPEASSETSASPISSSVISLVFGKSASNSSAQNKRVKKRKIKKVVRKVGRVYRKGKTDRSSIKKSRKIQGQARRIINIL